MDEIRNEEIWDIDSLFEELDGRIEAKEQYELEKEANRPLKADAHTNEVANSILRFVLNILKKADTSGDLIENVGEDLGKLAPSTSNVKQSQYNIISDKKLVIDLNYSKPLPVLQNSSIPKVYNFLDDGRVNWQYLRYVLKTYGVTIERELVPEDVKNGRVVKTDFVKIEVDKDFDFRLTKYRGYVVVKIDPYLYQEFCSNRAYLFYQLNERIQKRIEREQMENMAKNELERLTRKKTDEVVAGIKDLIKNIAKTRDTEEGVINHIDEVLGVLGTDLDGTERSHYVVDDDCLEITLNYSKNKDVDSYSKSFGEYVDWNYLTQQLLAHGIEISREVYDRNPQIDQSYHHFDIIKIKINRREKRVSHRL